MNLRRIWLVNQILENACSTPKGTSPTWGNDYPNTNEQTRTRYSVNLRKWRYHIPVTIAMTWRSDSFDYILPCSHEYFQCVDVRICCLPLTPLNYTNQEPFVVCNPSFLEISYCIRIRSHSYGVLVYPIIIVVAYIYRRIYNDWWRADSVHICIWSTHHGVSVFYPWCEPCLRLVFHSCGSNS